MRHEPTTRDPYQLFQKYVERRPQADRGILLFQCRLVADRINRRQSAPRVK